jgi:hypothetical protein
MPPGFRVCQLEDAASVHAAELPRHVRIGDVHVFMQVTVVIDEREPIQPVPSGHGVQKVGDREHPVGVELYPLESDGYR